MSRSNGFRIVALVLVGLLSSGCFFISRVSVNQAGRAPTAASLSSSISADGRHVAFASFASNLVPGDGNNAQMCSCEISEPVAPTG
jgi:hypothetical protein